MYYFYQNTILTVRPGIGEDNFATVRLKSNGGWAAVKSAAMPRVNEFPDALTNMHRWAQENKLAKADCDYCLDCMGGYCRKFKRELRRIPDNFVHKPAVYIRCDECIRQEE